MNIFILISGYFQIKSEKLNIKRLVGLWLVMSFYVLVPMIINLISKDTIFRIRSLALLFLRTLFPIGTNFWWFMTSYFMLSLISPFLNRLLRSLSKADYKKLIIILMLFWCVIPTLLPLLSYDFSTLGWFVLVYSVAGYIRLYPPHPNRKVSWRTLSIILYFLNFIFLVALYMAGKYIPFIHNLVRDKVISRYFQAQALLIFLTALAIFISFSQAAPKESTMINKIAGAMTGVYLIHDGAIVKPFIWMNIVHAGSMINSPWFIPYTALAAILVFIACTGIELLRQAVLGPLFQKVSDKIACFIERIYRSQWLSTFVEYF